VQDDLPYVLPGETEKEIIATVRDHVLHRLDIGHSGKVTRVSFMAMWKQVHHEMFDVDKIDQNGEGKTALKVGCAVM
jgi:hypothetical protein